MPGPELPIVEHGGSARAVVWPGSGAQQRSMHLITLSAGGCTIDMTHGSECVYHVSMGDGIMIDVDGGKNHEVVTGSMLFIEPGTQYQFVAGETGALLLGGPCPPDPKLYRHLGD